jgi:hypothetical protein
MWSAFVPQGRRKLASYESGWNDTGKIIRPSGTMENVDGSVVPSGRILFQTITSHFVAG